MPTVSVSDDDAECIATQIGRSLKPSEIRRIEGILSMVKGLKEARESDPTTQDVKATLAAIGKLPDEAVLQAVRHCDEDTSAQITRALYRMGERQFKDHKPPKFKAAALLALSEMTDSDGGRPTLFYRDHFAKCVVPLWRELTGLDPVAWETNGTASPLVLFAQRLLVLIGDCISGSTVAKLLRKVIA